MTAVAALVLAAGSSTRYRAADRSLPTKLVAELDGLPLVRHVACAALGSRARPVVVVTGHAAPAVRLALAGLKVSFTHNGGHAEGLSTSVRAGLAALPDSTAGALVLLGDMPRVGADLLDRLISAFEQDPGLDALIPVRAGQRGNPVLLGRPLFASAAQLEGDEGARRLLVHARVREVTAPDDAIMADIDDPEALRRLREGSALPGRA